MENRNTKKLFKSQKKIDGEKVKEYIRENKINQSELCEKIGVSVGYIRQAANRGYTNIGMWRLACEGMGVPEDFFDVKEPVIEEVKIEAKEEPGECGVDLADIQYSLNIFEQKLTQILEAMTELNSLMTEQNNLLSELKNMTLRRERGNSFMVKGL